MVVKVKGTASKVDVFYCFHFPADAEGGDQSRLDVKGEWTRRQVKGVREHTSQLNWIGHLSSGVSHLSSHHPHRVR